MSSNWFPPPSRPLPVDGGLKARSARGAIGQTWWSERFVTVLEQIGLGGRLQRGKNYARRGQVISLDIDAGLARARVQGSRSRPYRLRIGITAFGKAEWTTVEAELAASAWYAARLLAGEMPEDIEDVFAAAGLSLFPSSSAEMAMDCDCPDWQVPCKHIAAVFYLLAEAFDADPFAILAWRGRDRDDLLANLHAARADGLPAADQRERSSQPLAGCLDTFFEPQADLPVTSPPVTAVDALLGQVPPVPVQVRGHPIADLLRPAYLAFAVDACPADSTYPSR